MKKFNVAMAMLTIAALSSCQQEKNFEEVTLGKDDFGFSIGGVATRSADESEAISTKGQEFKLGDSGYILEETITELNVGPATKGTPVYTQNLTMIDEYKTFNAVAYIKEGDEYHADATFESMDSQAEADGRNGWLYHHNYTKATWPDATTDLYFFLRMPTAHLDTYAKDFEYNSTTGAIEFDYTAPNTGSQQKDILFSSRTLNKTQYETNYIKVGAPVTMYHALSGVKFRTGNNNEGTTKTIITRVRFKGLKDSGHCTVTPSSGSVVWSDVVSNGVVFTQDFENPTYSQTDDNTVDLSDSNNKLFNGTSLTEAAAENNLNAEDGSMTFWFVPQEIDENVTLEVTFCVKTPDTASSIGGGMITHVIPIGQTLKNSNVEWKAGQLRTYTLEPKEVDVEIFDTMSGMEKSALHVTNTGNVDEYVRMLVLGNWYGWENETDYQAYLNGDLTKAPSILVGYKYKDEAAATAAGGNVNDMVDAWYRGGYDHDGDKTYEDPYGTFDESFLLGDLGDRDGQRDDWADASGGYYFTTKIGPGEGTLSGTKSLFESYEVTNVPTIWIPSSDGSTRTEAVGVHLVMEIAIQAIAVPKDENGNDIWWLQAWYNATGINKLAPDYVNSKGEKPNQKYVDLYNAGEYAVEE